VETIDPRNHTNEHEILLVIFRGSVLFLRLPDEQAGEADETNTPHCALRACTKSREVWLVACFTDIFGPNSAQNRGAVAPGPIVQHSGLAMVCCKEFPGNRLDLCMSAT
jgi:hypothetical protein